MIYKNHTIEIYVNGKLVELESEESMNHRFNDVLLNPTKIDSTDASYSFEFELPATSVNNAIFGFANVLAKTNKFHQRYAAEVIADGITIFEGTLVINSYKDRKYNANLVAIKTYSLEEIFGNLNLSQIPWYIDFSGSTSINDINYGVDEVKFPLISYGVFQKDPYHSDSVANDYTSKFKLDEWNKWYIQSFYPSHNMLETVKKAFEWKGYNVYGDAFNDDVLKNIYMSTNLSSDQIPTYNLGNPCFGKVDIDVTFNSSGKTAYEQELSFPYFKVTASTGETKYNWSAIDVYDVLGGGTVTSNQEPSYMYQPDEKVVVIPADGFYKITLSASTQLKSTMQFTSTTTVKDAFNLAEIEVAQLPNLEETCPVEIQLVRNYEDNIELIKGKNNVRYADGNPSNTDGTNKRVWKTCFPHEDPYNAFLPTEKNDLSWVNKSRMGGNRSSSEYDGSGREGQRGTSTTTSSSGNFSGYRGGTRAGTIDRDGGGRAWTQTMYGYAYPDADKMMMFDQAVSDNFICGMSSFQSGCTAVVKNGYSWSRSYNSKQEAFYKENGYVMMYNPSGSSAITESATTFNQNEYIASPTNTFNKSGKNMNGTVSCMVWLNKDDVLELFEVHRTIYYQTGMTKYVYNTITNAHLTIEAASPNAYNDLKERGYAYSSATEFDVQLNLANFLNSGTTIASFIQGVANAFNLQVVQNGKNVRIDKRKKYDRDETGVVDLDNRVSNDEAESERIDYPKSMSVVYKIDTDEWGFEQTVPPSKINEPDWANYGDSGFTKIELNDDSYVTEENNINLNYSYTYYDDFEWEQVDEDHTPNSAHTTTISLPVISKNTYMIDGYDYDESMKHDGYSMTQRFWFKPSQVPYSYTDPSTGRMVSAPTYIFTDTYPQERIELYVPTNTWSNGVNLSYKVTEKSLLDYFNVRAYLDSNYVYVDVYLTAEEYNILKNGGKAKFDDDLYDVVEIEGYDPTGGNKTTLKLMKRTAL